LDSPRGVLVRKPQTSIYTVLLGISLAAITLACVLLWLEVFQFAGLFDFPWWKLPANLR
jgi:hypothetical protein